jgi:hypothetical protein
VDPLDERALAANGLPAPQDFDIEPDSTTVHAGYKKTQRNVENDIALIRLPRKAIVDGLGVQVAALARSACSGV